MDEQRVQAYFQLIEQLLACPAGEEKNVLQAHGDLVDAGLVEVMRLVADQMAAENPNNAGWLRQFAGQVAQALGLEQASADGTEDLDRFVGEVMVQISQTQGDPAQVYEFWRDNLDRFNQDFLEALPITFKRLIKQNNPELIAAIFADFGDLIQRFPLGIRWLNLEIAIAAYERALEVYTREAFPKDWARTQNNLANAYSDRIQGDREENMERAITICKQVLEVRTRRAFPQDWAAAQNNLAYAYYARIRGDRADNLEQAISAFQRALEVYTRDAFPEDWAMTQNNLATVYSDRILGNRSENLEFAIVAFQQALKVYTRDAFPENWTMTQNNLANAYSERIRGERAANLEFAISAYKRALKVYTHDAFPENWAMTQNNLGNSYSDRILGDRAENLEFAIVAFQQVLEVYTRDTFPEKWAATQNNLATAYGERIRGNRAKNLELAIAIFKKILQVYTIKAFPDKWAMTQNNLAATYRERIRGDRADNLELAIASFQSALEVRTRDAFPENWATTQNNLAAAYSERIRGDRADNIELAIASFQNALEVYTRDTFPERWAMVQHNLATAYRDRVREERADNLDLAITIFQEALEVYTHDTFPEKWAIAQNNLATVYRDRIFGERADNLELAIAAFQNALEVYTREAFPEQWAGTQNNLATAYGDRIRGERSDNLELAITAYEKALEVYTREAFPKECRLTSRSLGNLQSELRNWDAAAQAYGQALAAAEDLYQACTLLDSQAGELKETADLPRRAAYAYAKTGQFDKALETIERGRARGLSERLQRDRADLAQLQQQRPALYDRYCDITNQLQNLESQQRDQQIRDRQALIPEQHRNEAQRLRQELTAAIAEIRQIKGYETFLQAPSLKDIQRNLSPDAPTIYLIPTPNGSLALIAEPHAIAPLWLDNFTEPELRELLYGPADDPKITGWLGAYQNQNTNFSGWLDAIAQGTRQLWDNLMAPLIDWLQQHNHPQAILIPTSLFGLLPLHAAWTEDPNRPTGRRYALDDILFTYAPNAQSLVAARAITQKFPDSHLDSILAIDNPRQDLSSSEREVMAAVKPFPRPTILRHEKATTEAVKTALTDAAIVHFSCHGTANFNEPLNSGLRMNDALLTLRDLFALKLTEGNKPGIRLAVLSACETGLPGLELADEAIGLPVGLMQAGVAGAIASLWAVDDASTAILLTKFYDLWRKEGKTPPEALRQAQQWFRDTKRSAIYQETGLPPEGNKGHPYYWAGFSYTGL